MPDLGPFELDTIVVGDCLDVMRQMPDGCVDLVFADPPYFVGFQYGDTTDTDMAPLPYDELMLQLSRLSRGPVCITPGIANIWKLPAADWVLGWFKFGAARRSGIKGFNVWEPVLVYQLPEKRFWQDGISLPARGYWNDMGHPCPKPEPLIEWIVDGMTDRGDTIFDPFMGSGTTAVAAKKLGRHYFGCDINPEYVEMARQRVAKVVGVQLELLR